MNCSLANPSIHKFYELRLKLRQLAALPQQDKRQHHDKPYSSHKNPVKNGQVSHVQLSFKKSVDQKEFYAEEIQQTKRKNKKSAVPHSSLQQNDPQYNFLLQKTKVLNEINFLLQKKRQVLEEIEKKMSVQSTNISKIFQRVGEIGAQKQIKDCQKTVVRAPDLLKLREEKRNKQRRRLSDFEIKKY